MKNKKNINLKSFQKKVSCNGGEGDLENCSVKNVLSHRIKTLDLEHFNGLISSPESKVKFRVKMK